MAPEFLPVELIFNPNWWYHTAGISFDPSFYFDSATRLKSDVTMRQVLYERYGDLGLGEANPQPRPIIGSMHVAGGFVIPALLGDMNTDGLLNVAYHLYGQQLFLDFYDEPGRAQRLLHLIGEFFLGELPE